MGNPFNPKEKKFSVITPVFKDAYKTFGKFFAALDEQDYSNFEVIVVFDGQNKTGIRRISKIQEKYPDMDIKVFTKEWGGAPAARNYGFEQSDGDLITYLDPDVYLYPGTLREWLNVFDENPDKDVVWGLYDLLKDGEKYGQISGIPVDAKGNPDYWAFRFQNFCSGANPIRREANIGWDESVKSLQDWDMWVRMLKKDNFQGKKFKYMNQYNTKYGMWVGKSYFLTDVPRAGGISEDSHKNWLERLNYVKEKNGIPLSDTCVTSLGAPFHALHVSKKLGCDFLHMPSFKPHNYDKVYLLGFYPTAASQHGQVFNGMKKGARKIIEFIGTDIYQMQWKMPFKAMEALRKEWSKKEYKLLTEVDYTQKEMKEMGIKTKVVPIPPPKLYEPMPLPDEFAVGVYENATQDMYAEDLMQEVAKAMPDVRFYFFGDDRKAGKKEKNIEHIGWVNLDKWIPRLSCNLRITLHDGLPLTPLQFLTAGRQVVTNVPLKYTIQTEPKVKDIIKAIRKAKKESVNFKGSRYWNRKLKFEKFKRAIGRL